MLRFEGLGRESVRTVRHIETTPDVMIAQWQSPRVRLRRPFPWGQDILANYHTRQGLKYINLRNNIDATLIEHSYCLIRVL